MKKTTKRLLSAALAVGMTVSVGVLAASCGDKGKSGDKSYTYKTSTASSPLMNTAAGVSIITPTRYGPKRSPRAMSTSSASASACFSRCSSSGPVTIGNMIPTFP